MSGYVFRCGDSERVVESFYCVVGVEGGVSFLSAPDEEKHFLEKGLKDFSESFWGIGDKSFSVVNPEGVYCGEFSLGEGDSISRAELKPTKKTVGSQVDSILWAFQEKCVDLKEGVREIRCWLYENGPPVVVSIIAIFFLVVLPPTVLIVPPEGHDPYRVHERVGESAFQMEGGDSESSPIERTIQLSGEQNTAILQIRNCSIHGEIKMDHGWQASRNLVVTKDSLIRLFCKRTGQWKYFKIRLEKA